MMTGRPVAAAEPSFNFEEAPWVKTKDAAPLALPYSETLLGLNQEIEDFVQWISPNKCELSVRKDVVERLKEAVGGLWPEAKVEVFGSMKTDLCVPTSDIDLVVLGVTRFDGDLSPMFALADLLSASGIPHQEPKVLTGARVPIVKYRDAKSRIDVDIAFGVSTGLENATVVQELLQKNVYIRPLALILKHYLKQKGLNESYNGGLSSYALVLMIAGYLLISYRFAKATLAPPVPPSVALATHLVGFAEFYSRQFQYPHHVLSLREGGQLLPKMAKNWFNPQNPFLLSIEDPHNLANDVGASAYRIDRIVMAFEELYSKLMTRLMVSSHALAAPIAITPSPVLLPLAQPSPPVAHTRFVASSSSKYKTILSEVIFVPTFIMDARKHIAKVASTSSTSDDTDSPSGSDKEMDLPVHSSGDSEDDSPSSSDDERLSQNRSPRQVQSAPVERKTFGVKILRAPTPELPRKDSPKTLATSIPSAPLSQSKKAAKQAHARSNSNVAREPALQTAALNSISANSRSFPENPQRKAKEVLV